MRKEVAATIRRAAGLALKQHSMRRQAGILDSAADTRGAEIIDVGAQLAALGLNTQAVSTE